MQLQDWKNLIKVHKENGKFLSVHTAEYANHMDNVKLIVSSDRLTFKFITNQDKKCSCCKQTIKMKMKHLTVRFKNRQEQLSIFQAYVLYHLFTENKIPNDYASYHECPAGKEFIENIHSFSIE